MTPLCRRCLADADPATGGCIHDDLCGRCAWQCCRECEQEAADARAEIDADYDRENGAA